MIESRAIYRLRPDVRYRQLPPQAVLIRQRGPEVMVLNGVAGRILDLLDGATPVGDLIDKLADEFDAPRPQIETDLSGYLDELASAEVIERIG
jgi:hypothetical protein